MKSLAAPSNARLPVYVLVISSFGWGLAWWPMKYFGDLGIRGVALSLTAYGVTSVGLVPLLIAQRARWRGQMRWLLAIALLGGYANLAFTVAMVHGDVVRAMVLFYLLPAWGVLGGRLFLGERIDAARALAVTFSLLGAFLVLGGVDAFSGAVSWVDLVAISCGLSYSLNNIVFRASAGVALGPKVAAIFLGCAAIAAGLLAFGVQPWPQAPIGDWSMVALFGFLCLFISTVGTQWAVTHMEVGRASILIILELIVAVISAMWIGGERLSAIEALGGLLIAAGAVIEARRT